MSVDRRLRTVRKSLAIGGLVLVTGLVVRALRNARRSLDPRLGETTLQPALLSGRPVVDALPLELGDAGPTTSRKPRNPRKTTPRKRPAVQVALTMMALGLLGLILGASTQ